MSATLTLRQLSAVAGFKLRRRMIGWKFPASIMLCLVIFYFAGTAGDEKDVYKLCKPMMASLPTVAALSAVISASDSISEEFERGTGFAILSKPMYRETVFAGKYIACLICSLATTAIYCILVAARCSEAGFEMPDTALDTIPLAVLYIMAANGICLLFSALSPKSGMAMLAAFGVLIIIPLFVNAMSFDTEPWYSLAYESEIFGYWTEGKQTVFCIDDTGSLYAYEYFPDFYISAAVMGAYALFSALFATFAFRCRRI